MIRRLIILLVLLIVGCEETVAPDTTTPTVVITYPVNESTLTETTTVTVDVADDGEIGIVKLLVDGIEAYADTTAPYQFQWDVCVKSTGTHTLLAKTEDGAGNQGQSDLLTYTIDASYDCATVCGGDNLLDNCEVCDADTSNDCPADCNGEWGGTAVLDDCTDCVGGNTGLTACVQDNCGVWGGNNSPNTGTCDCAGTPSGDSWVSECGCVAVGNSGDDCDDCAGVANGGSWTSDCGCVSATNSGDDCDDCGGTPNGSVTIDDCGVCDGGNADMDDCGVCGGDGSTCIVCADCSDSECCDCDGNVYETIQIGDQLWMAENLKVIHYNNGDVIPTGYSTSEWTELETGAYAIYPTDDDEASQSTCGDDCSDVYGNLYNWYAVGDDRGVCPEEFHVPSDEELKELEVYLGMCEGSEGSGENSYGGCVDNIGNRGTDEGIKLAGNADLWINLDNNSEFGTSGFNGIPGGYRNHSDGTFYHMGQYSYLCSSSESSSATAWYRRLHHNMYRDFRILYKRSGFSIRCLAD